MEPNITSKKANNVKFNNFCFVFVIILVFCSFSIPAKQKNNSECAIESERINAENIYIRNGRSIILPRFYFIPLLSPMPQKATVCLLLPLVILFSKKKFLFYLYFVWFGFYRASLHMELLYILNVYT